MSDSEYPPTSSRGVLVVTSDPATVEVFRSSLRTHSEAPSFSDDLDEALERAQAEIPEVVFVDVSLGGGAGVALIHHLKAATRDARVVAMVPPSGIELGAQALSLGASAIVLAPPAGDEILSAVGQARSHRAETELRARLETESRAAKLESELARDLSALGALGTRRAIAETLIRLMREKLGARVAAVFVPASDRSRELLRISEQGLDQAPAVADELGIMAFGAENKLELSRLELGGEAAGLILHAGLEWHGSRRSALMDLVRVQAAAALALVTAREQAMRGAIKDPGSSAYTFAYFVDVAGREIDKSRRHQRRFSLLTLNLEDPESPEALSVELAERVLSTVRASDVLARVDEREFYVLLPETGGVGAYTCRRRLLSKLGTRAGRRGEGMKLAVSLGTATYPHDGLDLSALLRRAKRRAEAGARTLTRGVDLEPRNSEESLDSLFWAVAELGAHADLDGPRLIELPLMDLVGLSTAVVREAARGGAALVIATQGKGVSLGAMVRSALPERQGLELRLIDAERLGLGIEALAVVAEHGTYALLGRKERTLVRAIHASDPGLADLVVDLLECAD
ncbi:MAG: response regulator [Polyangiaceae bacterium]